MSTTDYSDSRVCGAIECHTTENIRQVRTASYGRLALCPEHRAELKTDIRAADHYSRRQARLSMHLDGDGGHE